MSISYSFSVETPKPAQDVFEYLADLRNLAEWDPEINATWQTGKGEATSVGATFRVEAARNRNAMDYELVELEPPRRIVARATSNWVDGIDTLTVSPTADGGTEVVYATEIELKSVLKVLAPLLRGFVDRSGEKTRVGLDRTLNAR
jgi:uncharacterized protein YndB with AHSA1/START domain